MKKETEICDMCDEEIAIYKCPKCNKVFCENCVLDSDRRSFCSSCSPDVEDI